MGCFIVLGTAAAGEEASGTKHAQPIHVGPLEEAGKGPGGGMVLFYERKKDSRARWPRSLATGH